MSQYTFHYCCSTRSVDVTEKCQRYITNDCITFHNIKYNEIFTDIAPGELKYLKITNISRDNMSPTVRENANFTMNLSVPDRNMPIHIVYFINTHCNNDYKYLMISQLTELKN